MKICTKCKQEKEFNEFTKDKSRKDGLNPWCGVCTKANNKRVYHQNIEYYRQKHLEYNKKHPEAMAANSKKYRQNNTEKLRIRNRLARQKEDPEQARARWNRRAARKAGALGSHTKEEWSVLCQKYDFKCLRCGTKEKLTRDHIIPLVLGGTDYIDNIQPLCHSCNASKGARHCTDYRGN